MAPTAITPPPVEDVAKKFKGLTASNGYSTAIEALDAARTRFVERNPTSLELHQDAVVSLPGGNTRSLLHSAPFPLFMKSGKGYQLTSEDGHTYTDFVGELTAAIYGHSNPLITSTLKNVLDNVGLNLGATIRSEAHHAKLICERFGLDRTRFTNSGTEANLHAIAGARHFTGKRKVITFTGAYHGGVFDFTSGKPAKNNVDVNDFVVVEYNNVEAAKEVIESTEDLAAVLVEGMQGAGPCICSTNEFLHQIQASANKVGAVFIFDEVMTSRLSPGGLQAIIGIKPDITSLGKYLGGGMTFGAFGGKADIMQMYDPRYGGALSHSGTFNNNTLGMAAGYVGLSQILTPEVNMSFNLMGDSLRNRLQATSKGTKMTVTGRGTVIGIHFVHDGKKSFASIAEKKDDPILKELFWYEMMEEGFWLTKRGSIAMILGTPESELDRFVECVKKFVKRHETLVKI